MTYQPEREYYFCPSVRFIARFKIVEIDTARGTPAGEVNGVLADDLSCSAARRIVTAMNAFEEPPTIEIGEPVEDDRRLNITIEYGTGTLRREVPKGITFGELLDDPFTQGVLQFSGRVEAIADGVPQSRECRVEEGDLVVVRDCGWQVEHH